MEKVCNSILMEE